MSDEDPYLNPGTGTLRNKLGITDPKRLERAERSLVLVRVQRGEILAGSFDLAYLQAIHRYLFRSARATDARSSSI